MGLTRVLSDSPRWLRNSRTRLKAVPEELEVAQNGKGQNHVQPEKFFRFFLLTQVFLDEQTGKEGDGHAGGDNDQRFQPGGGQDEEQVRAQKDDFLAVFEPAGQIVGNCHDGGKTHIAIDFRSMDSTSLLLRNNQSEERDRRGPGNSRISPGSFW